jgi:hypothetical protein
MTNEIDFDGVNYFCEALRTNQVKDVVYSFHTYFMTVNRRRLQY